MTGALVVLFYGLMAILGALGAFAFVLGYRGTP